MKDDSGLEHGLRKLLFPKEFCVWFIMDCGIGLIFYENFLGGKGSGFQGVTEVRKLKSQEWRLP